MSLQQSWTPFYHDSPGPAVQRLYVLQYLLYQEPFKAHRAGGQREEHKGVVRVRAVADSQKAYGILSWMRTDSQPKPLRL